MLTYFSIRESVENNERNQNFKTVLVRYKIVNVRVCVRMSRTFPIRNVGKKKIELNTKVNVKGIFPVFPLFLFIFMFYDVLVFTT